MRWQRLILFRPQRGRRPRRWRREPLRLRPPSETRHPHQPGQSHVERMTSFGLLHRRDSNQEGNFHITYLSGPRHPRRPCSICQRFISELYAIASLSRSVSKNFISEVDEKYVAFRRAFFGDTAVGKTQRTVPAIRTAGSLGIHSFH